MEKKSFLENRLVIAGIAVASFLVTIYVAGVILTHTFFMPNTYINDQEVSYKTAEISKLALLPKDTDFIIEKQSGAEKISLSEFDYYQYFSVPLDELIKDQTHFAWPIYLFKKNVISNALKISYDEKKFTDAFRDLEAFDESKITDPKDAYIERDEDNHYSIIPEVMGNRLNDTKSLAAAKKAIEGGSFNVSLVAEDCYEKPDVYSDDKVLNEKMRQIKVINEETITIDLTGAEEVLDAMEILELVEINDNEEITVKEEMLASFVSDLAAKYNTYLNERSFTTHDGRVISVGGNHTEKYGIDTYGFLMNQVVTTNTLRNCILSKESQTMYPAWDVPALTRNDVNDDIGNTYLELSLKEQHLWFYKNGNLFFDADVVTGLDTDQRRTPWGVFRAYEKDKDCTLKGEMAGERWNTHVDYWISVTWTGCGIHDATWQPSFGGDRYKYGGSHGCINVSLDTARTLYENLEVDTPIIIY